MTARWSGVPSDEGGDAPSGRISKQNAGGFSHSARRAVSGERVFATGARERTSVVEADSKHSGGASKVSRKAQRGAHRQATGRQKAGTMAQVIHFAQGCDARGSRKAEASPR